MIDENIYTSSLALYNCDDRPSKENNHSIIFIIWNNLETIRQAATKFNFREAIMENIERALLCRTIYLGYDAFECPNCGNENLVFRHCHCRFCNSCGVKLQKLIANKVANTVVDASHRHIVFTIPEELRGFFRKDRSALNLLFIAARNTLCSIVNSSIIRKLKRKGIVPDSSSYLLKNFRNTRDFGMIACLHTFGRDLKWNPHIHSLVPELVYDSRKNKIIPFTHFNFEKLRKTFQFELLNLMLKHFGDSFRTIKCDLYRKNRNGFYVYAKYQQYDLSETAGKKYDDLKDTKARVSYIMRYASRPAMAESRIISYDEKTNTVKWFYNRHEDEQRVEVEESGWEFIKKLIVHIPDRGFPMIRYYGFYNNRCQDKLESIYKLLSQKYRTAHVSLTERKQRIKAGARKYHIRTFIMDSYNRDILLCPCGETMVWVGTYNPLEGGHNDRDYRKNCIDDMRQMWKKRKHSTVDT